MIAKLKDYLDGLKEKNYSDSDNQILLPKKGYEKRKYSVNVVNKS